METKRLVILIALFCFCSPLITYACRYTIREIGYSDIRYAPQYLYVFTDSETSEKEISSMTKLSGALLHETNVNIKHFDVDKEKTAHVTDMLARYDVKRFPFAVFEFQEGDHMIFPLHHPGRPLNESVWNLFEELFTSAMRSSIKEKLVEAYCVVLVVEGMNRQQNKDVLREVKEAVREISMTMDQMPKRVDSPPVLLVLPRKNIMDERLLLMSLGITEKEAEEPSVAVLYGRGRVMGPVLQGDLMNRNIILNLLTIVGADCECGLDHSWILGRMIPMRWETRIQSDLTKNLGFDVENPLVKSEMTQILSLKPTPDNLMDPMGSNLLGYSEGKLDIQNSSERGARISASVVRKSFFQTKASKHNPVITIIFLSFGAILLIVLVLFLFIKYKRRKMLH